MKTNATSILTVPKLMKQRFINLGKRTNYWEKNNRYGVRYPLLLRKYKIKRKNAAVKWFT